MLEIIGKNGAGKTFIANKLYSLGFDRNIGYTTRPMRDGEINGIDYFFISEEEFKKNINKNLFVDYKILNGFHYGISKNNISDNTILVSGNTKKIEKETGYNIIKLYVDCDLVTRYLRVLKRNDSLKNIFNRFHTENFLYLYDFDAIFINNDSYNNISFDEIINKVINTNFIDKKLVSNNNFIETQIKKFNINKIKNYNNKLLILLKYEEYLLRKLFLQNNDLTSEKVIKEYYDELIEFLITININYLFVGGELYVNIDNEKYNMDYKIKRR